MSAQEGRIKLEQSACQAHTVDAPIRGQMQAGEDGPGEMQIVDMLACGRLVFLHSSFSGPDHLSKRTFVSGSICFLSVIIPFT